MTGPEHYQAAQKLLSEASFSHGITEQPCTRNGLARDPAVRDAMVATALGAQRGTDRGIPHEDGNAWLAVASETA